MWNQKKEPPQYNIGSTPLFDTPAAAVPDTATKSSYVMIKRDEMEVMSEARIRVIYGQEESLIVKYLSKELDIDSETAKQKIESIRTGLKAEFSQYIASCTQDNIMILKTMLTKALEKNDTRNAVEIMRNLDTLTQRYMEDNGLIEHKIKQDEIEIKFS